MAWGLVRECWRGLERVGEGGREGWGWGRIDGSLVLSQMGSNVVCNKVPHLP